jgi:hypothetical protein
VLAKNNGFGNPGSQCGPLAFAPPGRRIIRPALLDAVTAYCDRNQVELHPGDVMAARMAALGQLIEDSCVDAEGRRRAIKVIEEMLPYMESQLDERAAVRTGGIN